MLQINKLINKQINKMLEKKWLTKKKLERVSYSTNSTLKHKKTNEL